MAVRTFLVNTVWKPLTQNIILVSLLLGGLFLALGALLKGILLGEVLTTAGSTIIGAGVFTAVVKSSQFLKIFQEQIANVIYHPDRSISTDQLKHFWLNLTQGILKSTLPESYYSASQSILSQFLNSELAYHFDQHEILYDITVDPATQNIRCSQTSKTIIVISPGHDDPAVTQTFRSDGGTCELVNLFVNSSPVELSDDLMTQDEDDPQLKHFRLPLKPLIDFDNTAGDQSIRLERTYSVTQNLQNEPYFHATISRYVKGLTVKAKINQGYRIIFMKTGIGAMDPSPTVVDGEGYQRWVLGCGKQLLLPGQGYTLMIVTEES